MNAAAKVIHQSSLFQGEWSKLNISKWFFMQAVLLLLVLSSALSVVYLINVHRVTCSQMQVEAQKMHQLQLQWGQLLLEQASLAAPARVERIAATKLRMVFPTHDNTFVLRAE